MSEWITINPLSLLDLAVFTINASLGAAFYTIYWKLGRRRVDLIFANMMLCTATYAFGTLMVDNADAPLPALRWTRIIMVAIALASVSIIHFAFEFSAVRTPSTRRLIPVLYITAVGCIPLTYSPLFLQPRTSPTGPVGWLNVAPWLPEAGPLMSVFWLYCLGLWSIVFRLCQKLSKSQPVEGTLRRHTRLLLVGLTILMLTSMFSAILFANSINTVDFTLIGGLALNVPAAVALLQQLQQREQFRDALCKYVSPQVADDIIDKGLLLEGHLQEVTILAADIRNFTALAASLSPEQTVRLLNRYFDRMAKTIFQHGGMFNRTLGDGLLAIFGAPVLLPNHAWAAVQAAWRMIEQVDSMNATPNPDGTNPLRIGIGLHSGPVIIGNVGGRDHMDYTAIGDVVNVAFRVERHSKVAGRSILVTATTFERIQEHVTAEAAGEAVIRAGERLLPVLAITGLRGASLPQNSQHPATDANAAGPQRSLAGSTRKWFTSRWFLPPRPPPSAV